MQACRSSFVTELPNATDMVLHPLCACPEQMLQPGFTIVMPWRGVEGVELPSFTEGETLDMQGEKPAGAHYNIHVCSCPFQEYFHRPTCKRRRSRAHTHVLTPSYQHANSACKTLLDIALNSGMACLLNPSSDGCMIFRYVLY